MRGKVPWWERTEVRGKARRDAAISRIKSFNAEDAGRSLTGRTAEDRRVKAGYLEFVDKPFYTFSQAQDIEVDEQAQFEPTKF